MLEIIQSGGWLMVPIVLCSVLAAAIGFERLWTLQRTRVAPRELLAEVWGVLNNGEYDAQKLRELRNANGLGQVFAAGITNARRGREIMKEAMEEAAGQVAHDLERYLTALGIVAAIAPLLGLLGTVTGIINTFAVIRSFGNANPSLMAAGISEALVTTATGMAIAIPILLLHVLLRGRADRTLRDAERHAAALLNLFAESPAPAEEEAA